MLKRLYPRTRIRAALGIGPEGPPGPDPTSYLHLRYPVRFKPRYTFDRPHPRLKAILESRREQFASELKSVASLKNDLRRIPERPSGPTEPWWDNVWLPRLDAAALYMNLALRNPRTYLEVGSGHSTVFARRAIRDHGLRTKIVSIDPRPRIQIDALCDHVVRLPLEDTDLEIFRQLEVGDILFVDSSHCSYQNSDVTVLMMDVNPMLPTGVRLHFHDIYWPYDYPAGSQDQFCNEQYLLGAQLLATGGSNLELANQYIAYEPDLKNIVAPVWDEAVRVEGTSMWLTSLPHEQLRPVNCETKS